MSKWTIEVEKTVEIRIDDKLWDYVQSEDFTNFFCNFQSKEKFIEWLGETISNGYKLSEIDGFTNEHDDMVEVDDNYVISVS